MNSEVVVIVIGFVALVILSARKLVSAQSTEQIPADDIQKERKPMTKGNRILVVVAVVVLVSVVISLFTMSLEDIRSVFSVY